MNNYNFTVFINGKIKEKNFEFLDIVNLVKKSDNDFLPKISERDSVLGYCNSIANSDVVITIQWEGKIVGFVNLVKKHKSWYFKHPHMYLHTVIIEKEHRGNGLGQLLLEKVNDLLNEDIVSRTWSTNLASLKIHKKNGFKEIKTVPNDRGTGIDSVYFLKKSED